MIDGSIWVQGEYLCFVANGKKWRYLGDNLGTISGAQPGSIWIEGNVLHYIDSSSRKRMVPYALNYTIPVNNAVTGSLWIENHPSAGKQVIAWTHATNRKGYAHEDYNYGDHLDSHSDTHWDDHDDFHLDVTDPYIDTVYTDFGYHEDYHVDDHTDSHLDTHWDFPYSDYHEDWPQQFV